MLFTGLGRSVLGKTVPETEGTVFPNTDRPRPVNNIYIYLPKTELKGKENKLKQTPEKGKKETQPFVGPRLRTMSEIETLRKSPRGQPGKGKDPTPRQNKTDKF